MAPKLSTRVAAENPASRNAESLRGCATIAAGMSSTPYSLGPVEQRLTDLRNGLLRLHKTLLDSERAIYEREVARVKSANELLQLVMYDPWFAWLHELSELVVLIDETLESKEPLNGIDAERFITQARALLMPNETGRGFEKRYFEALQRDPDVVLAHAETRKLVMSLG